MEKINIVDKLINEYFSFRLDEFCLWVDDGYFYTPRSVGVPEQFYVVSVYDCFDFLEKATRGETSFRISVNPRGDDINVVNELEAIHFDFDLDKNLVDKIGYVDTVKLTFEEAYRFYKVVSEVIPTSILVFTGGGFYVHAFIKFKSNDLEYLSRLYRFLFDAFTGGLPRGLVSEVFRKYLPTTNLVLTRLDKQANRVKELARLPYVLHDKYKTQGKVIYNSKILKPEEFFELRKKLVNEAPKLTEFFNWIPSNEELEELYKEVEEIKETSIRTKYILSMHKKKTTSYKWVEEMLKIAIPDARKRIIYTILIPYLVCKKHWQLCIEDMNECVKIVRSEIEEWLKKCYELANPGSVYIKWVESVIRWVRNRQLKRGDILIKYCRLKYLKEFKINVNGVEKTVLEYLASVSPYFRKFLT